MACAIYIEKAISLSVRWGQSRMTTTDTGNIAEEAVSKYLAKRGYKIIARNWKQPGCEIDIVAQKSSVIFFVEVKYRRSSQQGSGFDYITKSKLQQMKYAAQIWVARNNWTSQWTLSGAEVSGDGQDINFVESIIV